MEAQGQVADREIERSLQERPRITLRFRIAAVFVVCGLLMAGITAGSMVTLSRFRTKMEFLEAADESAFEIQEARRYEKNFFLYGTSLLEALDHTYRARRLLEANQGDVERVIGPAATRSWLDNLQRYETLLDELAGGGDSTTPGNSGRREAEVNLRRYGATILSDASDMIVRERLSMNSMIRSAMIMAAVSLGFLFLLMIVLADQLARQVIRPIGRIVGHVERIANGDFSPITPGRKYRDELTSLAIAINRMLAELKVRQEQVVQSRKMAAVGTLTSGIAHELNNPLNNISLTVETLLDDFESMDDDRVRRLLTDAFTQVERAAATVRNLLDFTRVDRPVFTAVSLADVVDVTMRLVSNELSLSNVAVHIDIEPDLPRVHGNPRNIQQVFLNLILNAVQAMPDGGELTVQGARIDDFIRVAVRDTGVGIAAEDMEQIFEPFFSTKEAGEGTGLGLSVSYSIIEKHGGRIELKSRVGEGATFFVFLPIHRTEGD